MKIGKIAVCGTCLRTKFERAEAVSGKFRCGGLKGSVSPIRGLRPGSMHSLYRKDLHAAKRPEQERMTGADGDRVILSVEQREHGAHPFRVAIVEGQDHAPGWQRHPAVPVLRKVSRQDRRVAVLLEPVELGANDQGSVSVARNVWRAV